MKTTLRFKVLSILITLLLGIFASSCTKDEPISALESVNTEDLLLKNGVIPTPTEDAYCDLIAGQTILAGQLIISHVTNNIYVEYLTSGGWTLSEVHLYIGTADGVPHNKTAIQVGQFPYTATNLNGVTQYIFTIPIAGLEMDEGLGYAVFAHAVVMNGDRQETAWSNGCSYKPIITVKSYFTDDTWAASDGTFYSDNHNDYCAWLGINIYNNGDTYLLQSYEHPTPGEAGNVMVSDDGSNLSVIVTANGLTLEHSYLYVGSKAGLDAIDKRESGCPKYNLFPYQMSTESNTHSFVIPLADLPLATDISFETQFGSNRWGWFFYYNL